MMSSHDTARPVQNNASRKRSRNSPSTGPFSGQKRDKYTIIACNECRRRKMKCTGEIPCRRCESYELNCEYTQGSSEPGPPNNSRMKIASLEQNLAALKAQVDQLSADVRQMRKTNQKSNHSPEAEQGMIRDPANTGRPSTTPTQVNPRFIGPTSAAYNFNVANNTLQMMGIQRDETEDASRVVSATPSRAASPEPILPIEVPNTDPLFSIGMEETYRAIDVYHEEVHPVYPFVHVEELARLIPSIYEHLKHQNTANFTSNSSERCCVTKAQDVRVLKLVVACALVVEGRGQSRIGELLVDSIDGMLGNSVREVEVDVKGLQAFTLMSIYYFHADEPVLAWRTIGFTARIALEIGLHRRESLEQNFLNPEERDWAMKLFWSIYILDRRWSFGIGMPFALQDSDIDPDLPHLHETEPYLGCLIAYGQICSKVWKAVAGYSNKLPDKETVAYLDFQIQQWQQSLPTQFQLLHPRLGEAASNQPRTLQRLRVLLYVRANQMRGYIHRHNVLSASNISENLDGARRVTDIAKDTIRVLEHLRATSTIYDTQQSAFNYFLVSALSALFLAVCHAPAEFSHGCRNEFYIALGILKDLSAHSYISRRLWKSMKSLRNTAPKLGLAPIKTTNARHGIEGNEVRRQRAITSSNDNQQSASFDLTCKSTGHEPSEISGIENGYTAAVSPSIPTALTDVASMSEISSTEIPNMHQIGTDLTNIFEAFDNFVDGQPQNDLVSWMTEAEIESLQNGAEISRLFEGLL